MQLHKEINVTKVISVNRLLKSPVKTVNSRKKREFWAIILKTDGQTVYTVGENQYISDRLHPILIEKGCTYQWQCQKSGECFIIEFEAEQTNGDFYAFDILNNAKIINNFIKIEKALQNNDFVSQLKCKQYVYEILSFLFTSSPKRYIPKSTYSILQPAIRYISQNYFDTSITNPFLAQLCGVSTVYFRKLFEKAHNISPIRYLQNYRINKAKALLLSDYDSIQQVAESVGFNSIYHFSKMFKTYVGVSPKQFSKGNKTHIKTLGN